MEVGHGGESTRRVRVDSEQEQSRKRLRVDPACLVTQAESVKEFEGGISLERVKQELDEEPWLGCEAQRQPLQKVVETPRSKEGNLKFPGQPGNMGCPQSPLDACQRLPGHETPLLRFGSIRDPQGTPLAGDKTVKILKDEFPAEVGREEEILSEDVVSWDIERQKFREFCYYDAVGPRLTSYRLWTLCRKWLQPEKRTKEQIMEQVILEQFLAILPQDMRSWVRLQCPDSCPRAVALAEGFLLLQDQKLVKPLEKAEAPFPKAEAPPSDSCPLPQSTEIKQENGSGATVAGGGTLSEIKEENVSEEESHMEATAEGSAQESISSPSKSVLPGLPKEEPGTVHNPIDGTVRKIKEEDLSEEDALTEAPMTAEGSALGSISSPSNSAFIRLPKEEPGTACSPSGGAIRAIKEEDLSGEGSSMEALVTPEGSARWDLALPSRSASVGVLKEEPGTTCNPESLSSASDQSVAVKVEEKAGKSGEPESQGPALGREEEARGEREEVWTGYGKTFRWKSVLTPCKETATDWKIYQCCACGKHYDAKSIRAHQKMHTGEKLYECIYCGRTFSQRAQFDSHEKIHTGVKAQMRENMYICVTCGKSFVYYSTLVAHRRSHGDDDPSTAD